jgi:hypothetical protein
VIYSNPIRKRRALTLPSIKELMPSPYNILSINAGAFERGKLPFNLPIE